MSGMAPSPYNTTSVAGRSNVCGEQALALLPITTSDFSNLMRFAFSKDGTVPMSAADSHTHLHVSLSQLGK